MKEDDDKGVTKGDPRFTADINYAWPATEHRRQFRRNPSRGWNEDKVLESINAPNRPDKPKRAAKIGGDNKRIKRSLLRRDGLYCYLCGELKAVEDLRIEHKVPRSRGGSNKLTNLGLACERCDIAKGNLTPEQYRRRLRRTNEKQE